MAPQLWLGGKESTANAGDTGSVPGRKIPWRRNETTSKDTHWKIHRQRSPVSYNHEFTKRLDFVTVTQQGVYKISRKGKS